MMPEKSPSNDFSETDEAAWRSAISPLAHAGGWIRSYALLQLVLGVLLTLTLVGIVVSWAFFWVAKVLNDCAHAADAVKETGSVESVKKALDLFSLHVVIMLGMLLVSCLVAWVVFSMFRFPLGFPLG